MASVTVVSMPPKKYSFVTTTLVPASASSTPETAHLKSKTNSSPDEPGSNHGSSGSSVLGHVKNVAVPGTGVHPSATVVSGSTAGIASVPGN